MGNDTDPTINLAHVIPGDLIFLDIEDSPLDLMIAKLDKSKFAHVGIVVEPGVMASARTRVINPKASIPDLDIGGVRLNSIRDLDYRHPWTARPKENVGIDVSEVLKRTYDWLEIGPRPQPDASEFSFVKLFLIAAALNTFLTNNADVAGKDAMWRHLLNAAHAWEAKFGDDHPGFFCTEMVAHAFNKDFTLEQFRPPPKTTIELLPDLDEWRERLATWWQVIAAELERTLPELTKLRTVELLSALGSIRKHDKKFLKTSIDQLIAFLNTRRPSGATPPAKKAPPKPKPDPPDSVIPPTDYDRNPKVLVPRVLVTPRMISKAEWLGELKRIDFKPLPEENANRRADL